MPSKNTNSRSGASLAGRRILLGVTGGIAAYKSADLVRRLKEAGAEVQVVMTAGAQQFVTPRTFAALSGRAVREDLWDEAAELAMGHIELARWGDAILIAPASADFIARLAQGRAVDLLTTVCLASKAPVFVAPAMNQQMWANKATQDNLKRLHKRKVNLLAPGFGNQACGDVGPGRLMEPPLIRDALSAHFQHGPLAGVKTVVTAGPTREPLDPVRVLTNRSSGKMGFAVAQALVSLGAQVTLVAGPVTLPTPEGVIRIDIETAADMHKAAMKAAAGAQLFVGAAAVADYRPVTAVPRKIKKGDAGLSIAMERTRDILSDVRARDPKLFMVGFAAETENLAANARGKLKDKNLDMVAGNLVGGGRAFDRDDNELHVYWKGGSRALGKDSKSNLGRALAEMIAKRFTNRKK